MPSPFRRAPASLSKTVTVHFRFGDASLSAADKVVLDRAVASAPDARHIVISGHTDNIGPARANELLATARARTVHGYLRSAHPNLAPILKLDAQGACCYVTQNDTEQGRSLNRRVDVLIRGDEGQPP
jgi:outer membrane protein OmpA-like peptidoglycan-associated protein